MVVGVNVNVAVFIVLFESIALLSGVVVGVKWPLKAGWSLI